MSLTKGLLVAAAAIMVATPVLAQVADTGPAGSPPAITSAPGLASPAPSAASAFNDSEMRAFARATIDLQLVDPRDIAGQTRAIEATGMSVEKYNRMGDAMRADANLASRLNPYLASARAERPAIPGYTTNPYVRVRARTSSRSHRASSHHASSRHKSHARKSKTRHAASSKRGHKSAVRHARAAVHKKTVAHRATTHRKRHR